MAYSELPWRPFLGHRARSWTRLRRGNVSYYVYKRFLSRFLILFERSFISMVSAVASWAARVKTEQFTSSLNPIGLKHCVLAEFRSFGMCAYAQPRLKSRKGSQMGWTLIPFPSPTTAAPLFHTFSSLLLFPPPRWIQLGLGKIC